MVKILICGAGGFIEDIYSKFIQDKNKIDMC